MASFRPILGARRLPFLAIDTKDVIKPTDLTARGGGVLGMMKFGAKTTFALDSELEIDKETVETFVRAHGKRAVSHFRLHVSRLGQALPDLCRRRARSFERRSSFTRADGRSSRRRRSPTPSSGPPSKRRFNLDEHLQLLWLRRADRLRLHREARTDCSIRRISPTSSCRRPHSWEPAAVGEEGVIQVVSLLPRSYPGHSVLTEDMGVVATIDAGAGGRYGKAIRVVGRAPKTELRGCSDVIAA